ncbi:MAG: hypothetical protein PHQ95_04185 [Candidatus Gracilibacteria bacterium]|nr:hypothetical protein [Candidatus Gracilibacteria bacterium]
MNTKGLVGIILLFVTTQAFAAVGDYTETACTAEYFTINNCNLCFEGTSLSVGDKIDGLYDTWTNNNSTEQLIYKDEQMLPEMVPLSPGTVFTANPLDSTAFWKYGNQVIWTDSVIKAGSQEFMLDAGKSVKFLEADIGASYTLASTDKADGELVGVLKIPLAYHNIDIDGNEGVKEIQTECVSYTTKVAATTVAAPIEIVTPEPPVMTPVPEKMTTVKTGSESLIFMAFALLIAAGIVIARNRKVQ